jgi:hypothetical protein
MRGYDTFMRKTSIKNVFRYKAEETTPSELIDSIFNSEEPRYGAWRPDEE